MHEESIFIPLCFIAVVKMDEELEEHSQHADEVARNSTDNVDSAFEFDATGIIEPFLSNAVYDLPIDSVSPELPVMSSERSDSDVESASNHGRAFAPKRAVISDDDGESENEENAEISQSQAAELNEMMNFEPELPSGTQLQSHVEVAESPTHPCNIDCILDDDNKNLNNNNVEETLENVKELERRSSSGLSLEDLVSPRFAGAVADPRGTCP